MDIQLMDSKTGYEVLNEGVQVGKIIWKLKDDVMVMNGTLLDESLRGKDFGQKLLDHAADYARENGYKMQAVCPFVVKMFEHSHAYDDVKI